MEDTQMQAEVKLTFVKSTPGTHVYGTSDPQAVCKQVYLQKSSPIFKDGPPNVIIMTVTALG
jgi:ABC-type uncharacterized transport system substrate-binding protein